MESAMLLLGAVGLAVGTLDYWLVIRQRARRRADLKLAHESGVRGLARVMLGGPR